MSSKSRRRFDPEKKAQIVRRHLADKVGALGWKVECELPQL
jgi:transposase-like protein